MTDLFNHLKHRLQLNWNVVLNGTIIEVRDNMVPVGRGYRINVEESILGYQATLEFDDYAKSLLEHAEQQLLKKDHSIHHLFKNRNLTVRRYTRFVEDIFKTERPRKDGWWLVVVYRKESSDFSFEVFTDVIISMIFFMFPYAIEGEEEGAKHQRMLTRAERSLSNRALCLAFHGYGCKVCGIRLQEKYGYVAKDFIHVHHLNAVAESVTIVDPVKDMIPICPDCHAIAHLKNPSYTVDEIKTMLHKTSS